MMTAQTTYPMIEFQSMAGCLVDAIEAIHEYRRARATYGQDHAEYLIRTSINVGSWIGWAELRAYEWFGTDVHDRCRLLITTVQAWCRAELEQELRRDYRKKSPRKSRSKLLVGVS